MISPNANQTSSITAMKLILEIDESYSCGLNGYHALNPAAVIISVMSMMASPGGMLGPTGAEKSNFSTKWSIWSEICHLHRKLWSEQYSLHTFTGFSPYWLMEAGTDASWFCTCCLFRAVVWLLVTRAPMGLASWCWPPSGSPLTLIILPFILVKSGPIWLLSLMFSCYTVVMWPQDLGIRTNCGRVDFENIAKGLSTYRSSTLLEGVASFLSSNFTLCTREVSGSFSRGLLRRIPLRWLCKALPAVSLGYLFFYREKRYICFY